MIESLQFYDLADKPDHIHQIANWHQQEWSHLNPGETLTGRLERMQNYLDLAFIPSMWVAEKDSKLLGTAAIVESDMDTHPEYFPWLASVYVAKEYRSKGIGSALIKYVLDQAHANGYNKLFLYTPDQQEFYQKRGWKVLHEDMYHHEQVTLMWYDS